jgi:hypothetical protein
VTDASERRQRIQVRLYPTLAAHDSADAAYWAALPVAQRVLLVWTLSEAQYRLRGEFPDESGLLRRGHLVPRQGTEAIATKSDAARVRARSVRLRRRNADDGERDGPKGDQSGHLVVLPLADCASPVHADRLPR